MDTPKIARNESDSECASDMQFEVLEDQETNAEPNEE
jgi:hypothetical protein